MLSVIIIALDTILHRHKFQENKGNDWEVNIRKINHGLFLKTRLSESPMLLCPNGFNDGEEENYVCHLQETFLKEKKNLNGMLSSM